MTRIQVNRLLDILDRFAKVAERWAEREYPVQNENEEGYISRVGDRPVPQSVQEYNNFEPEEDRLAQFEKRLRHSS